MKLKVSIALNVSLLIVVVFLLGRQEMRKAEHAVAAHYFPSKKTDMVAVASSHRSPMQETEPEIHHFRPGNERMRRLLNDEPARVQLWDKADFLAMAYWSENRPSKITLEGGKILVGGKPVALELLRDYLDSMVKSGAIDYVVIFTPKESTYEDVFKVVEECRYSQVSQVFISHEKS